jgi:hypothetical protein
MKTRKPPATALELAAASFLKIVGNNPAAIIDAIVELENKLDALEEEKPQKPGPKLAAVRKRR